MKNKTLSGIILMLIAAMFVAIGQLFWKISEAQINLWLIAGFIIYAGGALIMTIALRFGKLSMLQPIFSFSYIAAIFLGNIFLNEKNVFDCFLTLRRMFHTGTNDSLC